MQFFAKSRSESPKREQANARAIGVAEDCVHWQMHAENDQSIPVIFKRGALGELILEGVMNLRRVERPVLSMRQAKATTWKPANMLAQRS
jgi:hypothetical protein